MPMLASKWGADVLKARGWVAIPVVLLEAQKELQLTAQELVVVLHMVRWWWGDRLPRPTKRSIARCMNVSETTVQRAIGKLVKKGFLKRSPRFHKAARTQLANAYDLDGLVTKLKEMVASGATKARPGRMLAPAATAGATSA